MCKKQERQFSLIDCSVMPHGGFMQFFMSATCKCFVSSILLKHYLVMQSVYNCTATPSNSPSPAPSPFPSPQDEKEKNVEN